MKVYTNYIDLGHPNRPGIKLIERRARIWHGTANYNPSAGDELHQKYMGRKYYNKNGTFYEEDRKTPFRFGGAHVFIDKDSATITVPFNEIAYGCGDRPLKYQDHTPGIDGYKGQKAIAYHKFRNKNNHYTINIELCMNDMTKWDLVLDNAIEFCAEYLPDDIDDYRHYDVTGKVCPSPFVNLSIKAVDPRWLEFKKALTDRLNQARI